MKHAFILVLVVLTLFLWKGFANSGKELGRLQEQLEEVEDMGDPKDEASGIENEISGAEGQRIFMGLLLSIGSAAAGGIIVWVYVLPFIAQRATGAIFEGGDVIEEEDPMRDARAFMVFDHAGQIKALKLFASRCFQRFHLIWRQHPLHHGHIRVHRVPHMGMHFRIHFRATAARQPRTHQSTRRRRLLYVP